MDEIISDVINFVSKTFPKMYSSLYLESLKAYVVNKNINRTQLRALVFINNNGEITMTDLCERLNIEKGSLTTMVDDLSKKGYLTRTRDIRDRRKYILKITDKGERISIHFLDMLGNKLESKLTSLDEADRERFIYAIKTLEEILIKKS